MDWEDFYTHCTAAVYGEGINARPAPEVMEQWTGNDGKEAASKNLQVAKKTTCDGTCTI